MRMKKTLLVAALSAAVFGFGNAHAFSFDFGDNDHWYPYPYMAGPGWVPPQGNSNEAPQQGYNMMPPPRLRSYDRQVMKMRRQSMMGEHEDALNELSAMLYGGKGMDRELAIKLAREIQQDSGYRMLRNFHPGSVIADGSRANPSVWQKPDAFKAKAEALQVAAGELADALAKQPTEGAIYLEKRRAVFDCKPDDKACKQVAVDPSVWEKFNSMAATCDACHNGFRGFGWW